MAALDKDKKIVEKASGFSRKGAGSVGDTPPTIYQGSLLMLGKDDGKLKPVSASVNTSVVGVAADRVTAGSPYDLPQLEYRKGIFLFEAGTGVNALSGSMAGQRVYASDDQTVNATSNGNTWPLAGRLDSIDFATGKPFVLVDADLIPSGSAT